MTRSPAIFSSGSRIGSDFESTVNPNMACDGRQIPYSSSLSALVDFLPRSPRVMAFQAFVLAACRRRILRSGNSPALTYNFEWGGNG